MYRTLAFLAGAYIAGIVSKKYEIALLIFIFCILLVMALAIARIITNYKYNFYLLLILCSLAFYYGSLKGQSISNISKTEQFVNDNQNNSVDIICRLESLNLSNDKLKAKIISLTIDNQIFKPKEEYIYVFGDYNSYSYGDIVSIKGDLSFYKPPRNPGEFDLKSYYLTRNIIGYISPVKTKKISQNHDFSNSIKSLLNKAKHIVINNLQNNLSEEDAGTVISIITGDRSYLDNDIRNLYQKVGFAHILAISGLHISILALGFYKLLRKLGVNLYIASSVTLLLMLVFTYFADEPVSCKRAVVMLGFSLVSKIVGRKFDGLTALAVAALLILINQPAYIYDSSFLLTFSAGLGIIAMIKVKSRLELLIKNKLLKNLVGKLVFAVGFQLFMLPVSLQFYYSFCPYSILLNIVLLPFMSGLLVFGILVGVFGFGNFFVGKIVAYPLSFLLFIYKKVCELVSYLPKANIVTGHLSVIRWLMLVAILLSFVLLICKTRRLLCFWLIIPYCLVLSPKTERLIEGQASLKIKQLYVGQGDCCILMYRDTAIAIDMGSTDVENIYARKVQNALNYYGYEGLDYIFISHGDYDHTSGLYEVLSAKEEINILVPEIVDHCGFERVYDYLASNDNLSINELKQFDKVKIAGLEFYVLFPDDIHNDVSDNESSMVLYMSYKDKHALFMGDLGMENEEKVVEAMEQLKLSNEIDYFKVAHHGSKYSTGDELLSKLEIKHAYISVGEMNFYGHPHDELLARLSLNCSKIYRTDQGDSLAIKW